MFCWFPFCLADENGATSKLRHCETVTMPSMEVHQAQKSHTHRVRFTMRAVHVPGHFVGPLLARALYRSLAFSGSTRCTTLVHLKLMHHAHSREIASPKLCL
jgi:hypothetical protein